MEFDEIIEVGIDGKECLYVCPGSQKFPYIYREAMEVSWDIDRECLLGSKLRKWNYLDWYKQIISAAKKQSFELIITENTRWVNIPDNIKNEILELDIN